jgi:hypothetical protein
MRCRQCSKSGLSVEAEPFDCAADDQDFGERSAVDVVAGRADHAQPLQHHTNQAAIIALFRVVNRYLGNLAPMPGVFPDYPAPVVRNSGDELEMTMMRWGMPLPTGA